ncbi:Hypothetical predicted protein [Mytilus galloprovincialis]|uniref:Formyltetrahydrofolate dehydrogenase n=1 Tax=Mytilus galloprovincialis TaxID=29158 RepID=A0A8B6EX80_MYTGA|nr:Hypothetical predicted protein [Mytilus galloprovincialis]
MFASRQLVRLFSTSQSWYDKMRIAIIGQSMFGADVYRLLQKDGHHIVGVFTVPDVNGKPDPLALAASTDGIPVFKYKRWQLKKQAISEVLEEYKSVKADLNVLPFCSQFIPMDVINFPKSKSIIYHPSILPRHRGASAINWTLIQGDPSAGFSVFWADDGLDTGPILLQKKCYVAPNDTVDSIYNRFLYPEGVKAMGEAVKMITENRAPSIVQSEEGATYDAMLNKKALTEIKFDQTAQDVHNFIRGCDKVPGAWATVNGQNVTLFGSRVWDRIEPRGTSVEVKGSSKPGIVHKYGLVLFGNDGKMKDDGINEICTVVAALNFGNTYSGYAFSTKSDFEKNPLNISINTPGICTGRPLFGKRYPTCILFDSQKKNVLCYGYDAEKKWVENGDAYRESCFFFSHLRETLKSNGVIENEENVLEKKYFQIWRYLEALIAECKNEVDVTRWVITVPTYMTDTGEQILKMCIKKAGIPVHQLTLVTDAEASFAYCQKLLESERNFEGSTEYMIVDLGDNNADIRVVKKVCGELRVKYRQTRTVPTPSIFKQFLRNLNRLLSSRRMDIIKKDPLGYLEIERGLEEVKLSAKRKKPIIVHLHQTTLDALKESIGDAKFPQIDITNRVMILYHSTYAKIFRNLIEHVTSRMEKVFEVYREANKVTHIVMTGDFYQCCLVKESVEIKFPQKRIISSAFEEETVVKGAVLYGWQPFKYTFEVFENSFFAVTEKAPMWRHLTVTISVAAATVLIAMTTDCLGIVLTFNGVVVACPLAFIIPPLCVMKLRQEPVLSKENIFPILVATFGILASVIGIIVAVYNLTKGIECSHGKEMFYCLTPSRINGSMLASNTTL